MKKKIQITVTLFDETEERTKLPPYPKPIWDVHYPKKVEDWYKKVAEIINNNNLNNQNS